MQEAPAPVIEIPPKPAMKNASPINVSRMEVSIGATKKEAPPAADQNKPAEAKADALKKDEVRQSKETFDLEKDFMSKYLSALIEKAKIKPNGMIPNMPKGLQENMKKMILEKLNKGEPLDQPEKAFLGDLDFIYPPKELIKQNVLQNEPRMSITELVDYYFQPQPKGEVPVLTPEKRKLVVDAAKNLGLIVVEPGKDGIHGAIREVITSLFASSKVPEDKIAMLVAPVEQALGDRLILTKADFDIKTGVFAKVGQSIKRFKDNQSWAKQHVNSLDADEVRTANAIIEQTEGLDPIFTHSEVVTLYLNEALNDIRNNYSQLERGELKDNKLFKKNNLTDWFKIFGPDAGPTQTEDIKEHFFGKDSIGFMEFKKKARNIAKGASFAMFLMMLGEAWLASKSTKGQPQQA